MSDIPNAGAKARELLANDMLKRSFQIMREQFVYAATQCDVKDDLGRFKYLTALKVIDGVTSHLQAVAELETGQDPPDPARHYAEKSRSKLAAILNL